MKHPRQRPLLRLLVLATSFMLLAACDRNPEDVLADLGVSVPAERRDLNVLVVAQGELESGNASPVTVPPVPTGALTVKEIVAEGSLVEEGQVVVVFDDSKLSIDLKNHVATFRSTDRRMDRTRIQSGIEAGSIEVMKGIAMLQRNHASTFELMDETIFSRKDILENEIRRDDADATIGFANASLLLRGEYYDIDERILGVEQGITEGSIGRVESSLGKLILKAPIGGMVVYKKNWRGSTVAVGDSLWPGNVIMSIVDPTETTVKAYVLERDAASVSEGKTVNIRVDARADRVFRGEVTRVARLSRPIERGSPVKYFETFISIADGDPELLKPGMKAEVRIEAETLKSTVIIPRSALRGAEGKFHVLVATMNGPERRSIELGAGDHARVAILKGLAEGERVLLGDVAGVAEASAADAKSGV
jgi:HlyD family secretion protein